MALRTQVLSLGWLLMVGAAMSAAEYPVFKLHQVTLAELKEPSGAVLQKLNEAVFTHGMFAVVDAIPTDVAEPQSSIHQGVSSSSPFAGTLSAFVQCVKDGKLEGQVRSIPLEDGTIRSTLATQTHGGHQDPFPRSVEQACPNFVAPSVALRHVVDETGQAYASVLDGLLQQYTPRRNLLTNAERNPFLTAVKESESLEHFHVYNTEGGSEEPTLRLHSDMGLFIVMTAAEYFSTSGSKVERLAPGSGKPESGFILQLANGQLVKPIIPDGSLIVMNGDGSSRWTWSGHVVRGSDAPTPFSPGHEMKVPRIEGVSRAWFGRMYFPPSDAKLVDGGEEEASITFGAYRKQQHEVFRQGTPELASALGCMQTRRLLQDTGSCAADEMWCWHQCRSTTELECSEAQMECVGSKGIWPDSYLNSSDPDEVHTCLDCKVVCSAESGTVAPPPPPRNSADIGNPASALVAAMLALLIAVALLM